MDERDRLRLVTHYNPKSPVAEAYRILRTNLNFAGLDRPFKTLLITSAGPSDGKSTTLGNLGIAMAQAGVATLIIDCDLRKPMQHKIFNQHNLKGFTNLLVDRSVTGEELIRDTEIPRLKLLTSGPIPPNPSELLASKRTFQVIEELQEKFQLILIDSPPVAAVADAAILAAKVDGVIVVIRSHVTRLDLATQAKSLLDKANANILEEVLNGVPMSGDDYYYYYYYGHGNTKKKGVLAMLERSLGSLFQRWRQKRASGFDED